MPRYIPLLKSTEAGAKTTMTFTKVVYESGKCYPGAGALTPR